MSESKPTGIPETLTEAAGRSAAALTTRFIEAYSKLPLGQQVLDPVMLQSAFTLAFEQGANWGMDRAIEISVASLPAVNRRAV